MSNLVKYDNNAFELLTKEEQKLLNEYEQADLPGLTMENAAKCFSLFMDGVTPKQLSVIMPHVPLGAILKTKVQDNWRRSSSRAYG